MKPKLLSIILILSLLLSLSTAAPAQEDDRAFDRFANRELPDSLADLKLETPVEQSGIFFDSLDPSLLFAENPGKVIIRLTRPSVAEQGLVDNAAVRERNNLRRQQAALLNRVQALDPNARVIAQTQIVLNAVFVEVDASILPQLANDPAVLRIAPVGNYEKDLFEMVPYIGASAAQDFGFTGKGIKVAVLDSGIDYTHTALGGSGDTADYFNNDPNIIEPGTFPIAKVVGGYDFVGSVWPNGPEMPDPDPLDDGPEAGHGTHVAHIIGGIGGVASGCRSLRRQSLLLGLYFVLRHCPHPGYGVRC